MTLVRQGGEKECVHRQEEVVRIFLGFPQLLRTWLCNLTILPWHSQQPSVWMLLAESQAFYESTKTFTNAARLACQSSYTVLYVLKSGICSSIFFKIYKKLDTGFNCVLYISKYLLFSVCFILPSAFLGRGAEPRIFQSSESIHCQGNQSLFAHMFQDK